MLPAGLPVPIPAVIPVTDVAMILVPAAPRIIPAAKPVQLSAGQPVVTAIRHAQAAVRLIPEVLWDITNAAAPAGLVQPLVRPVLPPPTPAVVADQPRMNAEPRLVIILINPATPTLILVRQDIRLPVLTDIQAQLTKNVLVDKQAVLNVTNVTPPLPAVIAVAALLGSISERPVLQAALLVGKMMDNGGMFAGPIHIAKMAVRKSIFVS